MKDVWFVKMLESDQVVNAIHFHWVAGCGLLHGHSLRKGLVLGDASKNEKMLTCPFSSETVVDPSALLEITVAPIHPLSVDPSIQTFSEAMIPRFRMESIFAKPRLR